MAPLVFDIDKNSWSGFQLLFSDQRQNVEITTTLYVHVHVGTAVGNQLTQFKVLKLEESS